MDAAYIETILPDGSTGPELEVRAGADGQGRDLWVPKDAAEVWRRISLRHRQKRGKPIAGSFHPTRGGLGVWCPEEFLEAVGILLRESAKEPAKSPPKEKALRKPPKGDAQRDFFVPAYDVASKDSRTIMDVAVFRLSKKDKRPGEVIVHAFPDKQVEVTSGAYGMASVWDYDIVLMMIAHLAEATNRYRKGLGEKPGRTFRPNVTDILKFARRPNGGRQYKEVESALNRLSTTMVRVVQYEDRPDGPIRIAKTPEGLIGSSVVISRASNGNVLSVEITVPSWIYNEVVDIENPNILTVHQDYFVIESGLGRFIYRVARRSAGKGQFRWGFKTLYERSGSAGTFKEFTRMLRKIIKENGLPEYMMSEEPGQSGPLLILQHRDNLVSEDQA